MFPQYNTFYQPRNDHEPGSIYLLLAEGYHGIIPGLLLKRCKIGLSRNVDNRLDQFHSNQPPCNISVLMTIYVKDMALVEGKLHRQYKRSNVKLKKSKEWFDLWVWQIWILKLWWMRYHKFTS